jgi:uncharacterized membrane protein
LRLSAIKATFLGSWREYLLLGLPILLYAIVFSLVMIIKFYALETYAYDLGNYNQALYTTLQGHGLLYYTADLPVTGGSMMGVHFSPILLLILPIYAIYPAPQTLLVLKTLVLALGAYPLFRLAKRYLKTNWWGVLFSAVYLFNPMLQGANWFDFHPEDFFLTFCLFSLYYGIEGKWPRYFVFVFLALMTTEHSAILVFVNSLYLIWINKDKIRASLQMARRLELRKIDVAVKYPVLTMFFALFWLLIAVKVILFFSPNPLINGGVPQWSILGANGIFDIPIRVITSPQSAFSALAYDWQLKLVYLLILFGSTAFLSFLSPKSLILAVPWLSVSLLSNYPPFYYIGNQYAAFLLPSVMVGAVMGTKKLQNRALKKHGTFNTQKVAAAFLLTLTLVFFIASTPLYSLHVGAWPDLAYGIPTVTEHDTTVWRIVSLIPANASVLTQQNIFPLVSSRTNSYVIPIGSFYPPGTDFNATLDQWMRQADFVLVDSKTSLFETYLVFAYMKDFGIYEYFHVYASADGIVLLKRSYSGEPILFVPYEIKLDSTNLVLTSGEVVTDLNSSSQKVLLHGASNGSANDFCHSSLFDLPPGEYETTFRLKTENNLLAHVAEIDISKLPLELSVMESGTESIGHRFYFILRHASSRITFASEELVQSDFPEPSLYAEFKFKFSVYIPSAYEVNVTNVSPHTNLYLDWINLTQIRTLP